jgi:hypothetical protein
MLTDPPAVTAATQPIAAAGAIGYGGFVYGKKEELKEEEDKVVELEKHTRYGVVATAAATTTTTYKRTRWRTTRKAPKERAELPAHYFFPLGQTYSAFLQGEQKGSCGRRRELKAGPPAARKLNFPPGQTYQAFLQGKNIFVIHSPEFLFHQVTSFSSLITWFFFGCFFWMVSFCGRHQNWGSCAKNWIISFESK